MLPRLAGLLAGLVQGATPAAASLPLAWQQAAAVAACSGAPLLAQQHQQQHQQWPQLWPHPQQQHQWRAFAAAKAKGKQQQQKGKGKKGAAAAPKKKAKQRIESKPFDDKDPLLQRVVAMLVPQERPLPQESPEELAAAAQRAKEYSAAKMAEHKAWRASLHEKLRLKRAALRALPPALRAAAAEEDLAPFPLTRHALYETPPEGYRG